MRPTLIVVDSPRFNLLSRIVQRDEHLRIQILISKAPVELSITAFSTGFPGRIKSSFTSWAYVSFPVKATLPMENFWLPVGPDTAPAAAPPAHHGAVPRCNSATIPR